MRELGGGSGDGGYVDDMTPYVNTLNLPLLEAEAV